MSKLRSMIALFAVLVLLVVAYVYIEVAGVSEPEPIVDDRIKVLEFGVEEIIRMVLKSQNYTLTIFREGEGWTLDYPYPLALDKRKVENIAYSFTGLSAEETVAEAPQDLTVFGLDNPSVEAEVTLADGREYTIYLGNRTPIGNSFYMMKRGDPRVFTIWSSHGNHFSYTLNDLRKTSLTEINIQEITYFKLVREGERTIEITEVKAADEAHIQLDIARWHMVQPYNEYMSVQFERFNALLASLPRLEIERFVDDNPENLALYGLDKPSMEIKLKDKQNTLHLFFGNEFDEDHIHFMVYGSDAVYAMEKDLLTDLKATQPFDLSDRFAYIVMIDYVDKITIENNDLKYTLTLSRKTQKSDKQGEEGKVITTYAIDGKEVGEEEFKNFYQILIGLIVEAENHELLEEKPVINTTFFLNRGDTPYVRISYVPYNEDFFAVLRGGEAEFLISRKQVYQMLEGLKVLTVK